MRESEKPAPPEPLDPARQREAFNAELARRLDSLDREEFVSSAESGARIARKSERRNTECASRAS